MKITKSKLSNLIKEELTALLKEDGSGYSWGMRPPSRDDDVSAEDAAHDEGIQEFIYNQVQDNSHDGPLSFNDIFALTEPQDGEDEYIGLVDEWEDILRGVLEVLTLQDEISIIHDNPNVEPLFTIA
jgi:hypothetical protein